MYGLALVNPAGVQLDLRIRVFGLRFLAGICILIAVYGIFVLRNYRRHHTQQHSHHQFTEQLHRQMLIQNMQQAKDQEFLTLFVAYIHKFITKNKSTSLKEILHMLPISSIQKQELLKVYYGNAPLEKGVREEIMKYIVYNV